MPLGLSMMDGREDRSHESQTRKIISGLFTMRDMSTGIWFLNNNSPFTSEQFEEFDLLLKKLLSEIFSAEIPFTQTEDEKRCGYCAYQSLCNR